jgi:hypothetical protein
MLTNNQTGRIRRALMAGVFVAAGALTIGAGMASAQAQYYQYNNPYYANQPYGYGNDYGYRHAWWQWRHEYWRWYHQNYGR